MESMKGIVIKTNGEIYTRDFTDFPDVRRVIDCELIEVAHPRHLSEPFIMLVDEEGLLKDRPVLNSVASGMYGTQTHRQPIVGTAVIMADGYNEDGERDIIGLSVPDAIKLTTALKIFGCTEIADPDEDGADNG